VVENAGAGGTGPVTLGAPRRAVLALRPHRSCFEQPPGLGKFDLPGERGGRRWAAPGCGPPPRHRLGRHPSRLRARDEHRRPPLSRLRQCFCERISRPLPDGKTLDELDVEFQPSVDAKRVRKLATGRFIAAENVLLCHSRSRPRTSSSSSSAGATSAAACSHHQPDHHAAGPRLWRRDDRIRRSRPRPPPQPHPGHPGRQLPPEAVEAGRALRSIKTNV
jgi:hypothetical protein